MRKKSEEHPEESPGITTEESSHHIPQPAPPEPLDLVTLHRLGHHALLATAEERNLSVYRDSSKHHLVLDIARDQIKRNGVLTAEGILEFAPDAPMIRWPLFNFQPTPADLTLPVPLLRQYELRPGLRVAGIVGPQSERRLCFKEITAIEGIPSGEWKTPLEFDKLTAMFPNRRIYLEQPGKANPTARAVDLIAPLGMGQRGLIVAPPRVGKTMMLKSLALAIRANHPDVHLMLLLVDERPEEVTDLRRSLDCDIFSSTFDEPTSRHVQVSEMVSERAKRLVELKKDVVILVDSITRLSRGYNNNVKGKGRTMSGGVDSAALARPKKFFGSARNVEEGGSLTILATALVETHSRMDDLIFEEYKGTGNMEIYLDRSIMEQRIFPAIHITKSGTRREELLYHPDEYDRILQLRRQLMEIPAAEGMQILGLNLETTKTNAELLLAGLKGL
ncbi:MAG: Transcription termination factor Rho [Verrucomicrobiota bacterium]|jgi:transcription termination factor Rho